MPSYYYTFLYFLDLCLDWKIPDGTYLETSAFISVDQYREASSANELASPLTPHMEHSIVNLNGNLTVARASTFFPLLNEMCA